MILRVCFQARSCIRKSISSMAKDYRNWDQLLEELKSVRKDQKVVFTNGCFDLLHIGHVHYLRQARQQGDLLFLGLNSDRSVKELKGPSRPLQTENERAEILSELRCVDFVAVFDEDTPYELIRRVEPDVLVKGGDWSVEKIVGADLVLERGGEVKSLDFVDGRSTTKLIEKMS